MSSSLPAGVLPASVTPFRADRSLAHDAFAHHVKWLLSQGCDAVLLFGTTGEGLSLTVEERTNSLHSVLRSGVPPERLLVGTGALALPDAAALSRSATEAGVGGVLVLPPFHFRQVADEGVFQFYDQLIQAVGNSGLHLYFYHYPELTGVPVPFSVIQRLQDAYPEQIAGIKDSSGEWDHTQALCQSFPNLQVFSGTERLLLPVLEAGGAGCISATTNVTAPLAARVFAQWRKGHPADAVQNELTDLRTAFARLPTIAALKHVLATWHEETDWSTVRPPLCPLNAEQRDAVDKIVDRLPEMLD